MPATAPAEPLSGTGHHEHKSMGDTIYRGPLASLPARGGRGLEADLAAFDEDGCLVIPNALSPVEVAALRAFIDRSGGDDAQYEVANWCFNKHLGAAFHRMPELAPLVDHAGVVELVERLHGDDCRVVGGSLWVTGAGREMGIHVDYLPIALPEDVLADPRVRVPAFTSTAHYYLDDMDDALGPTLVIPGSHRAGRPPRDESTWHGRSPLAARVRAGDCLLFRGEIWHGAAKNTGPRRRYLIQVHYANIFIDAGGVVPVTDPRWPAEVLATLNPRQRRLLGDRGAARRGSYVAAKPVVLPEDRR